MLGCIVRYYRDVMKKYCNNNEFFIIWCFTTTCTLISYRGAEPFAVWCKKQRLLSNKIKKFISKWASYCNIKHECYLAIEKSAIAWIRIIAIETRYFHLHLNNNFIKLILEFCYEQLTSCILTVVFHWLTNK